MTCTVRHQATVYHKCNGTRFTIRSSLCHPLFSRAQYSSQNRRIRALMSPLIIWIRLQISLLTVMQVSRRSSHRCRVMLDHATLMVIPYRTRQPCHSSFRPTLRGLTSRTTQWTHSKTRKLRTNSAVHPRARSSIHWQWSYLATSASRATSLSTPPESEKSWVSKLERQAILWNRCTLADPRVQSRGKSLQIQPLGPADSPVVMVHSQICLRRTG